MAKSSWGRKHLCLDCQAPFYDMRSDPITCPKCGAVHRPVALLKSDGRPPRRNRLQPILATAPAAEPQEGSAASPDPETPETDDDAAEEGADEAEDMEDGEVEPVDDGPTR